MRTNYRINSGVHFEMLSKDQLQALFDGVLHVLENIGLDVHHDEARDTGHDGGHDCAQRVLRAALVLEFDRQ